VSDPVLQQVSSGAGYCRSDRLETGSRLNVQHILGAYRLPNDVACFAYINLLTAGLMIQHYCTGPVQHVATKAATSTIACKLAGLLNFQGI